ncbi:hypothetical protein NDU88_005365 [Pleurodeles waltl]|uniref:Uncharacterized protein n=1 Tax=Pleurodeles waltl TaxID=8319 RepID=A0AAV7PGP0_PLEWA|nr:hypothetical protein NDU88_005365 [Pleurodeles waltl]
MRLCPYTSDLYTGFPGSQFLASSAVFLGDRVLLEDSAAFFQQLWSQLRPNLKYWKTRRVCSGRVSAGLLLCRQVCVVAVFYLGRKGRKSTPPPGEAGSSVQRGARGHTPMCLGPRLVATSSGSLRREPRARRPGCRSAAAPAGLLVPRLLLMSMCLLRCDRAI